MEKQKSTYDLTPLEEAQSIILNETHRLEQVEVDVTESPGRTLADDVVSKVDVPDFANSGMDGYAVIAADLREASPTNHVTLEEVGQIPAGTYPNFAIKSGQAARIMTGAPMPEGADTVVKIEEIEVLGKEVMFQNAPTEGRNVRPIGNDILKGEPLYKAGQAIHPPDVGILTSIGLQTVPVFRKPRIGVLSTGAELRKIGSRPTRGKIHDTNRPTLMAFLQHHGFDAKDLGTVIDDPGIVSDVIHKVTDLDVLITNGGVSAGDFDYIPRVVKKLGGEIFFHRVRIKPGMPFMFARLGNTLVFGLPGNPQAVVVGFHVYLLPALRKMSGCGKPVQPNRLFGTLAAPAKNKGARPHFLPGKMEFVSGMTYIHASPKVSSGALSGFAGADCLVIIPAKTELKEGSEVRYMPLYGSC